MISGELEETEDDIKKALERFASQMDGNAFGSQPSGSTQRGRTERRVSWVDKIPTRWYS